MLVKIISLLYQYGHLVINILAKNIISLCPLSRQKIIANYQSNIITIRSSRSVVIELIL